MRPPDYHALDALAGEEAARRYAVRDGEPRSMQVIVVTTCRALHRVAWRWGTAVPLDQRRDLRTRNRVLWSFTPKDGTPPRVLQVRFRRAYGDILVTDPYLRTVTTVPAALAGLLRAWLEMDKAALADTFAQAADYFAV